MDPLTASAFLSGFSEIGKGAKASANSQSGDAKSGFSPVDASHVSFGDFIVRGGKDSLFQTALIVAGVIIVASILTKKKKK